MNSPEPSRIDLSAALDLVGPDAPTTALLERHSYTLTTAPNTDTQLIGEGVFAAVFYAKHKSGRPAAIKIFKDGPNAAEYFDNETEALELQHFPKDFGPCSYGSLHESGSRPIIVLEFIRGKSIHEYVQNRGLSVDQKLRLVDQLCRGVERFHNLGWAHRDIHRDNVVVTDDGLVRLLDFGSAGTIGARNQSITARGNIDSPPEVTRGDIRPDDLTDIYNVAALAIQILTGKPMPKNETKSGDSKHLAHCRKQLKEAGAKGSLCDVLLKGLREPERRYAKIATLANRLEDWRVRRPQRIRFAWLATAAVLLFGLLGTAIWWRLDQEQQRFALREYHALQRQARELANTGHEAVAMLIREATEIETNGAEFTSVDAARASGLLRRAVRVSEGLDRSLPRRQALGIAITATPWVLQSPVIARRKKQIDEQYQQVVGLLDAGKTDEAWQTLDGLQQALAELTRDNAEAGQVLAAQSSYDRLSKSVAPRLRELDGFVTIDRLAADGRSAWNEGEWKQSLVSYRQAEQRLGEWLPKNETVEERAARQQNNEELLRVAEQEKEQVQSQLTVAQQDRDDEKRRVAELQTQIAKANAQSLADREESKTTREQLQAERDKRWLAEQTTRKQTDEVTRLTNDKKAADAKVAELGPTAAELAKVRADLDQTRRDLDRITRERDAWKQAAEAKNAEAADTSGKRPAPPTGLKHGQLWSNSLGIEFIAIQAGEFDMGPAANDYGSDSEKPRHRVQITRDFLVGRDEVTQAQFEEVMGFNPSFFCAKGSGSSKVAGMDTRRFPVEQVSWFDAIEFCNKLSERDGRKQYYGLSNAQRKFNGISWPDVEVFGGNGYRLPTEAEWEYVARAGTSTVFPWGDSLSAAQANFNGNQPVGNEAKGMYLERPTNVGEYSANPWGLRDTAGNVWEWVWDWYDSDYYKQFSGKVAVDPLGGAKSSERVLRGGGWYGKGGLCRPSYRIQNYPTKRDYLVGFRLALGR